MDLKDKICIAPHQIFDYDLDTQDVGHNGAEEYIRKNALVDWLNERLVETQKSLDFRSNKAFAQVIDKLNDFRP